MDGGGKGNARNAFRQRVCVSSQRRVCGLSPEGSFLVNMMSFPDMIRNVAVVGHLHHGKTALLDMLIFETHKIDWNADNQA